MKKNILIVLFFAVAVAEAQYPKQIIQLRDKNSNSFSLNNPAQYISARAIARRTRYNIAIDSTDLPVTVRYLDSIRLAGNVTILSVSKWLNQVLIQSTDNNALNKINNFSFVAKVQGIGLRTAATETEKKFKEVTAPVVANTTYGAMDDLYNYGNSFNQVHIHEGEFLHNKGFNGQNMHIAVLDAGFRSYKTITAFDSIRTNGQVLGEKDFVAFDNSVNEDDAHGMQCLSILSANWPGRFVGTAPKSSYWLLRTEYSPSEFPIEEHNWVVGAEFADSTGSDMISSSLGYYDFDDPSFNHTYADFYKNATTVTRGATMAAKKGIIVMNSAGNEGTSAWKYLGFPADADSVCAVGATNAAGTIANFSSYGYPGKVKPNIVSVGAGTVIAGFNNQPTSGNGTSYSNPNIAGLIACLWQAFPQYNNMKILDAVYKSADRYTSPSDRYGYGIPNFKIAYRSLKKESNTALYGSEWLFATPSPFTTQIDTRFIGQTDGTAKLDLVNNSGEVVATQTFTIEKEEVYNYTFLNTQNLVAGIYYIRYTDNTTTRQVQLESANMFVKDWLYALPNPFKNTLTVRLKTPEAGTVSLRLLDISGKKLEVINFTATANEVKTVMFNNAAKLQRGVYFIEYQNATQKRTIKLLKQ